MAHLVKDASRAFLRALQVRLAAHEVQLGHWVFLRILWQRAGAADAALLTQRELSIEAGVMEPTTFVALRGMAALGYVTLEQSPENRKNVYVRLAPRGSALEQTLVPLAQEVNRIALQGSGGGRDREHPALPAGGDRQPGPRRPGPAALRSTCGGAASYVAGCNFPIRGARLAA